ncbi:MAG TPA: cytochrome P450 [Terriglobales bacterium]|jgi:cytochrome P450|nr:cytochrome P450 [Terriglobales bacterium]
MPAIRRPPGPPPRFLVGHFPLLGPEPLAVFTRWARDFGDIFYYRAGWIHVYFLNHPDLIESVLISHAQNFAKDKVIQNSRWFLGQGLLTSEGSTWLRQRRLCQPAFHRQRLASYGQTMGAYTEEMLAGWKDGEVRDVHQEMMRLTMRIVAKVLFSVEVSEDAQKVAAALNLLMRHTSGFRMIMPPPLRHLPLPALIRVKRAVRELDEIVNRIIRQRRASGEDTGDLLSMLMASQDLDGSAMTDRQLRDEIMTFLLAGHETTAVSLSWTWYLLSQHPDAAQKLRQELSHVLGGRTPELEDLAHLPYTEKVVKESMRLYPPAWSLARTTAKEMEVGGYRLPVGANVVMSPWIMHRDPRFFERPERFDPNRWTAEKTQQLPRFAYFPFGGGPRLCIGASFATMEANLVLATMAQRFQLHLVPGHPTTPQPGITLRPRHGMRMTITSN